MPSTRSTKQKTKWHVGCSGFHYREWRGVFYPDKLPQRSWFEYYSSRFDTLELNVTFYRFPQPKMLKNWYTISPAHFKFSVKVPRLITHYKQFNDTARLLDDFYTTTIEGLKEKTGAILFQLPPQFDYTPSRLDQLITQVHDRFTNVMEFRHASWWQQDVYDALAANNIIFCGHSYPKLPDEPVVNLPIAYYRFHGIPKLYYSQYDQQELKRIGDALKKSKTLKEAFIFFNNTAALGAIKNAEWIKDYLDNKKVKTK